ncbi:uncharacterized protein FRV6_08814 [Fusarium oxysporum]|uniref:Uncharacterized protein n=1 Tax=Fusarium oxysporum TaxID=5507 RepID=A0A2H3T7Z4_FUSOX|nr:uncharacterized protein FRV6_08814 [Fusarium oxysporum]
MPVPPLNLAGSPMAFSSARSVLRCSLVDQPRNWPKGPQESSPGIAAIPQVHDELGGPGFGSKSDAQQPVASAAQDLETQKASKTVGAVQNIAEQQTVRPNEPSYGNSVFEDFIPLLAWELELTFWAEADTWQSVACSRQGLARKPREPYSPLAYQARPHPLSFELIL